MNKQTNKYFLLLCHKATVMPYEWQKSPLKTISDKLGICTASNVVSGINLFIFSNMEIYNSSRLPQAFGRVRKLPQEAGI